MLYSFLYKVILIGDTGVGKSTLFSRLTNAPHDNAPTIGIELGTTLTVIPDGTVIKINLWDTAGQEFYHSIVKNYYRDIVGAIFVFDLSNKETFEKIKHTWLEEFNKSNQNYIKNMLVGNKSDLVREVSYLEAKEFAEKNGMKYHEISSINEEIFHFFYSYIEDIYINQPRIIEPGMGIRSPPTLPSQNIEYGKCCIII
jgi:Ras-related protein Rab-11A